MKNLFKKIIAIIAGWFGGSIINMGLIELGHRLFPIEGVDLNDMEALAAVMPNLDTSFFIFPFLGHALGTLVGAFIAAFISKTNKMRLAFTVGLLFLIGGIAINYMLPGPVWFAVLDIVLAYIPMAWLGGKLAKHFSKK